MTHDPTRDCEHGRLKGKCDVCDLQAEVLEQCRIIAMGAEREDALRAELTRLKASIALNKMAENARELGLSYDDAIKGGVGIMLGGKRIDPASIYAEPKIGCVNHDCDQCKAVQEPVYWNVVDPAGNIVASETDAIRGWARIAGSYKPTVEGLLGFHDQGWRVLPKVTPPAPQPVPVKTYHNGKPWPVQPKPWVGLTDEERNECTQSPFTADQHRAIEAKLKEKNGFAEEKNT